MMVSDDETIEIINEGIKTIGLEFVIQLMSDEITLGSISALVEAVERLTMDDRKAILQSIGRLKSDTGVFN